MSIRERLFKNNAEAAVDVMQRGRDAQQREKTRKRTRTEKIKDLEYKRDTLRKMHFDGRANEIDRQIRTLRNGA